MAASRTSLSLAVGEPELKRRSAASRASAFTSGTSDISCSSSRPFRGRRLYTVVPDNVAGSCHKGAATDGARDGNRTCPLGDCLRENGHCVIKTPAQLHGQYRIGG